MFLEGFAGVDRATDVKEIYFAPVANLHTMQQNTSKTTEYRQVDLLIESVGHLKCGYIAKVRAWGSCPSLILILNELTGLGLRFFLVIRYAEYSVRRLPSARVLTSWLLAHSFFHVRISLQIDSNIGRTLLFFLFFSTRPPVLGLNSDILC